MYGNSDNHKLPIEAYVDNKSLVDAFCLVVGSFVIDQQIYVYWCLSILIVFCILTNNFCLLLEKTYKFCYF